MMRAIALVHAERPGVLVATTCLHRAFVETFPGAPTLGLVDAHVGASWADLK